MITKHEKEYAKRVALIEEEVGLRNKDGFIPEGYVDIYGDTSCLDGWFSISELEKIILVMKRLNDVPII